MGIVEAYYLPPAGYADCRAGPFGGPPADETSKGDEDDEPAPSARQETPKKGTASSGKTSAKARRT